MSDGTTRRVGTTIYRLTQPLRISRLRSLPDVLHIYPHGTVTFTEGRRMDGNYLRMVLGEEGFSEAVIRGLLVEEGEFTG